MATSTNCLPISLHLATRWLADPTAMPKLIRRFAKKVCVNRAVKSGNKQHEYRQSFDPTAAAMRPA
jgi:hypothetical protein